MEQLTRDAFLTYSDQIIERVDIPEMNGFLYQKSLTEKERVGDPVGAAALIGELDQPALAQDRRAQTRAGLLQDQARAHEALQPRPSSRAQVS